MQMYSVYLPSVFPAPGARLLWCIMRHLLDFCRDMCVQLRVVNIVHLHVCAIHVVMISQVQPRTLHRAAL